MGLPKVVEDATSFNKPCAGCKQDCWRQTSQVNDIESVGKHLCRRLRKGGSCKRAGAGRMLQEPAKSPWRYCGRR